MLFMPLKLPKEESNKSRKESKMKVGLMKQVDGYCVFIRVFSYGMMVVFMKTQVILIKGHKDRPVKTTIWEV